MSIFFKSTTLLCLCIFLVLGAQQATKLTFDNSQWFQKEHPQKINLDYLNLEYETGEAIIFIVDLGVDYFQSSIIATTKKLGKALENLDYVNALKSPLSATVAFSNNDSLSVVPFSLALEKKILPSFDAYRKKLQNSFYYKRLISTDSQKIAFVLSIEKSTTESNFERRQSVIKTATKLFQAEKNFDKFSVVGEGMLNYQLDLRSKQNLKFILPLALVLLIVLLLFIFSSLWQLFIIIITALLCLFFSLDLMVWQNHSMTVVGLALPALILVIAIADSIHIVSRWNYLIAKGQAPRDAVFQAIEQTWLPCLGTSITTAVGFGSFYFSNLLPLVNFGLVAFGAIFGSYFIIMLTNWLLLTVFADYLPAYQKKYSILTNFVKTCFDYSQKFKKLFVYGSLITAALMLYQLSNITVETNFLDVFFKKKSVLYQDFLFADQQLNGTGAIDIIVSQKQEKNFKQLTELEKIKNLTHKLGNLQYVTNIQSYLEPIQMIHQELTKISLLPKNEEELEQELLFLEFSRGDNRTDVISPHILFDYSQGRIHLQTPNLSSDKISNLKAKILSITNSFNELSFILTGTSIFFYALSEEVLRTQLTSIIITVTITWIIFMILFGWKLGTIALLPSILPILITSGTLIFLAIPFDFAVILIGSISFGLCVDDTIHLVHNYKKHSGALRVRLQQALQTLAHPLFFTTILFCIGAGVFLVSDLVVLIKFGFFTCFTVLIAFFSTVILLPALIAFFFEDKISL